MQLIELTKDIEHEGLSVGDVLSVDERSAANLIKAGEAKEFEPKTVDKAETIDDIPSTAKPRSAVMSAVHVGSADPGPVAATVEEAEDAPPETEEDRALAAVQDIPVPKKSAAKKPPAASGAQPAGGDAGGGDTG